MITLLWYTGVNVNTLPKIHVSYKEHQVEFFSKIRAIPETTRADIVQRLRNEMQTTIETKQQNNRRQLKYRIQTSEQTYCDIISSTP